MDIRIKKIAAEILTGNASGTINTYRVTENGKDFLLTRVSHAHGRSIGMAGQKGILYVDSDDNRVHRQVVALSGACGLNTDDEPVEGLSLWALRGVIMAEERNESEEITITGCETGSSIDPPLVLVNGKVSALTL